MKNDAFETFGEQVLAAAEAAAQLSDLKPGSSGAVLVSVFESAFAATAETPDAEQVAIPSDWLGLGGAKPSATTLFNVFVHEDHTRKKVTALRRRLARQFDLLARPGDQVSRAAVLPGDVLVRVARGEEWGHIAFVASAGVRRLRELAEAGLRGEGYPLPPPGWYVHVVEIRPRPRTSQDRYARRIGDEPGIVLPDTLLLRPLRPDSSEGDTESAAETNSHVADKRPILRLGASGAAVLDAQRMLNRVHADSIAVGLSGFTGGPLAENSRFDARMEQAVLALQQQVFPDPAKWTGMIDPETWAQLDLLAGSRDSRRTRLVETESNLDAEAASGAVAAVAQSCPDVPEPHRRLSIGSQNPSVREAQRKLNLFHTSELAAGRPGLDACPLVPDCMFGQKTLKATKAFQRRVFPSQPQEWDGIIGDKTWAKLDQVQPPSPSPPSAPKPQSPTRPAPAAIVFDTNPQSWFLTPSEIAAARGNVDLNRTLSAFTTGNLVQPLIDGEAYMRALHDDLVRTRRGDIFHFTAWRLNVTQDLIPPSRPSTSSPTRFDNVVRAAAARGVTPRALIWKAIAAGFAPSSVSAIIGENTVARNFFNSISGRGVIDGRYPAAGAHHQKTAIIVHDGEAVAYCGGIDVCPDRWDTQTHRSDPRRTREIHAGWHDVHLRLRGRAALDIELNFRDRWNEREIPSIIPPEFSPPRITTPLPPVATSPGTHNVQVLRTYACIPPRTLLTTNHYNDFAPVGETTILAGYLKAIAKARNYIYIEDQYLVSEELARALGRALQVANKLIILVPRDTDGVPAAAFNFHQDRFLTIVRSGHPGKVHIYHPVQPSGTLPIYVHAKVMIIDDVYAVVGSPNINRRGITHDTEIAAAVVDSDVVNGVCRYARDLRRSLWGEHLNLPPGDSRIADPIAGVAEWERQAAAATFRVRRHVTPGPMTEHPVIWDAAADPDGRCRATRPLIASREGEEAEVGNAEFVETADLIAAERLVDIPPGSLLHDILSQTGLIWTLVTLETGQLPSLAEIFDAVAYELDDRVREQVEQVFEIVASPSTVFDQDLEEGDVLIRRGEGDSAEVAVIASPLLLDLDGVAEAGLTSETDLPGKYVHVVEAGDTPHTRNDAFAKRVTDMDGVIAPDTLLLRARPQAEPIP